MINWLSTLGAIFIAATPFTLVMEVQMITATLVVAGAILLPLPISNW